MKNTTAKSKPTGALPLNPKGSWLGGFARFVFLPVWLIYIALKASLQYFLQAPRVIQIIMVVSLLGLFGLGAIAGRRLMQNRLTQNMSLLSVEFNSAAIESDEVRMQEVLEKISALQPDDQFIKSRIEAVKTGIASPEDSDMCMLMARVHARHKRTAESAREAKKRLAHDPNDWLCNCIIAQELLRKNEITEAQEYLERVGNVDKAIVKPNLGMVLHAIELRQIAGMDNTELRSFIVARVLPNFRNSNLEQVRPEGKIQIIYTYITATLNVPEASLSTTLQYWAIASRLSDQFVPEAEADGNVSSLKQFGGLMLEMQNCVFRFFKNGLVDRELADQMYKEVDDRGEAAWTALQKLKPDDPAGYAGKGGYLIKAKNFDEAEKVVVAGIQQAGPHPELLRLLIILDERKGLSDRALLFAREVARKNPDNPNVWRVLIDAAKIANRRDIAIQACVEMRKARPGLAFPDMAEGILWLETGEAHKSLECLNRVDEKLRWSEPAIAQAYAKALVNSGNEVLVPEFIIKAIDHADLKNIPNLALGVLKGYSETEMTAKRADFLIIHLDRILVRWAANRELTNEAQRLRGDALFYSAELSDPRWEPQRLERAVRTFESLKFEYPAELHYAIRLAQLQLFGQKKAPEALVTVTELAKSDNLTTSGRNILGAVYVANGKFNEAVAVLEPLVRAPQVSGDTLTQLAKAYLGQGDTVRAKAILTRASYHKMTERERAEYRDAALAITRE